MSNYTLQDVAGSVLGVGAFALLLYSPGFLLGYATNLFGFRRMRTVEQSLWAMAYSFGATPLLAYLVGKYAGLTAACALFGVIALAGFLVAWHGRSRWMWSRREKLVTLGLLSAWAAFVVLSLVDMQVGTKLYFSVTEFDQSYRVAFTNSVLRTGVPPMNPLYFAGQLHPMRYYYFWYVLCAMVARMGHVSARQAFIASSVWAGFGLAAMIGLYVRHFFGVVQGIRRHTLIAVALLAVTGADLLPAIGSLVSQPALNGDMEWWSIDQISSWQDSLLWVPHHVASLLCCLLSFLLLWRTREPEFLRHEMPAIVIAALAFASAAGLSIYLALGSGLLMLVWLVSLVVGATRDHRLARRVMMTGLLGGALLAPFLAELVRSGSRMPVTHLFSLSVRRMIDPDLVTRLPIVATWQQMHPVLLEQGVRLLFLLPGLGLELGFYGAVLWLLLRARREYGGVRDAARETVLVLGGWGLVMVMLIRSAVISNNDFGFRAAMLPQFFLLLLGADVLASWWIPGRPSPVAKTRWNQQLLYGLMAVGLGGTVYQAVMLRMFLPLEARYAEHGFAELPAEMFAARKAFEQLDRVAAPTAVVAFNAVDAKPESRGEVVSPNTFFVRAMVMNAGRQMLSAEPGCATAFGGDPKACGLIEQDTAHLYARPAPDGVWAMDYCRRFGVTYLAVSAMDSAWGEADSWAATLPRVASESGFRIVRCLPGRSAVLSKTAVRLPETSIVLPETSIVLPETSIDY